MGWSSSNHAKRRPLEPIDEPIIPLMVDPKDAIIFLMNKFRLFSMILALVVFLVNLQACKSERGNTTTAEAKTVSHPYMYLTADRRDTILENIQTEPMATIYTKLQATAAKKLVTIDTTDWVADDHGDNGAIAVTNAFLAWLNNDESAASYALGAMELLESNWDDHTGWGINIHMPGPLIQYTAAWDFLMATSFFPADKAKAIEEKLTSITEQFYNEYLLNEATRELSIGVAQNNHPIRTAAAIGFVGLAFQNHPQAKTWLDWAVSELDYLMGPNGQYVQPDGAISEGPFYFDFGFAPTIPFYIALENKESPDRIYNRNCLNRSDIDPWEGHGCVEGEEFKFTNPMYTERFRNILDWSLSLRLPNGNRAPIADAPLRNQSAQAIFTHFGAEDYLYWDWESNPSDPFKITGMFDLTISHLAYVEPQPTAPPPTWKNRFFIDGGMANFRSGWESDDRVLVLMGENGAARKTLHDHADGTSFVMGAYGELLITDTGYYKPNKLRNAVTAAPGSHNIILIDGNGAPDKGLLNNWGDADAFIENTIDGKNIAYAESRQTYQNTQIIRGVTFVRERYFVIADQLTSDDTTERKYQFRLHAYAGKDLGGTVTLEQFGPHIQREKGSLQVYTAQTTGDCTLEEPPLNENASPHVHRLAGSAQHHTVTDSVSSGKSPDFLTVLAPYKTGATNGHHGPMTITPIATTHGAAWQITVNGNTDIAWIRESGAPTTLVVPSGETINTDGYFSLAALDKSFGILSRGTKLEVVGRVVVSATTSDSVKAMQ
ncbi:MAG: heparinase II/III family protein [Myxococcota bacterium]|nr:heparinase II/III family protein [Myxococcota bacterium]